MAFSPLQILSLYLRGLIAAALITASIYCWREWYNRSHVRTDVTPPVREDRRTDVYASYDFDPDLGPNLPTLFLLAAALTAAWSLGGGLLLTRLRRRPSDPDERRHLTHAPRGDGKLIRRPDGSNIYTESEGPIDAPALLLTHGWGANSAQWNVLRPHLKGRYRVVRWDLPGLGRSERRRDRDFSLDRMADDLRLVLDGTVPHGRPVVLVGHSIGAMILLTVARRFPDLLRDGRVAGMVFAHGTYTNPLRTHHNAKLYTKLQKPLIEPLCYAAIPLYPLLLLLNWASYLNGSAHRSTRRSGFSDHATRHQVDFAARFALQADVSAVARGTLAMLHWDATDVPPRLDCPVLFWAGENDPTTRPEASRRMRDQAPQADLHTHPAARHLAPIEYHAAFATRLLEFADTCFGQRAATPHVLITPPPPPQVGRPVTARAPGAESDGDRDDDAAKTEPDRATESAARARAFDAPEPRGDGRDE